MLKGLLSVMVATIMLGSWVNAPLKDSFATKARNIAVNKSVATLQSNGLYLDNLGNEWYLEDVNSKYALVEFDRNYEYVSSKELKEYDHE